MDRDCANPIMNAPVIIRMMLTLAAEQVKTVVVARALETKNKIEAGRIMANIARDMIVRVNHSACA